MFTDGGDNARVLRAEGAVTRAQKTGIPVYVVAEGDALTSPQLMKLLRSIANGSGANVYEARHLSDVGTIFHDILGSVQHTYMLAYKPPPLPTRIGVPSVYRWRA